MLKLPKEKYEPLTSTQAKDIRKIIFPSNRNEPEVYIFLCIHRIKIHTLIRKLILYFEIFIISYFFFFIDLFEYF
jgi:hypothetical protein